MMNRKIIIAVTVLAVAIIVIAYFFISSTNSLTTITVNPSSLQKMVGEDFTLTIDVSNIRDLYGWQSRLGFNAEILGVLTVVEGSFLKSGGSTYFNYAVNDTAGYVLVDCSLLGDISGVNGTGVLVSIQFHIKSAGGCDLSLYDTSLIDHSEQTIAHTAVGGRFSSGS
jgi:hypothetical protein